jgi:large subunit ribosomal protein L2
LIQKKKFRQSINKISGRNNIGAMTLLHRGGGHNAMNIKVDYNSNHCGVAKLLHVQYDTQRSALIGLFMYRTGHFVYRILPTCLKYGTKILISNIIKKKKISQW